MLTLPANYTATNSAIGKEPIYVLEVLWANGLHGTEGLNDIYFASRDLTDSGITNMPYPSRWYPVLDVERLSNITQQVDPINGVSSIGSLAAGLLDKDGSVSDIIHAADIVGHGLRRQRCELYRIFANQNWMTDKVKIRTMQISDLILAADGISYTLHAQDIQRNLKRQVFTPAKTALSLDIAGTGAFSVSLADTSGLMLVTNETHGTAGFIKIDDEIMKWTSKAGNLLTVPLAGRGMFGTIAATHAAGTDVQEIVVLRGNPFILAMEVMASTGSGTNGVYDTRPAHWGVGLDAGEFNVVEWTQVGQLIAGLSATPLAADGIQFEFVLDKSIEAKRFIEDDILKIMGAFARVTGDGLLGCRAYNDLANALKENASRALDVNNVVTWSALHYDYTKLANEMWLDFDESPRLSGKYIRASFFIDSVSQAKWGRTNQLKYKARGIIPNNLWTSQIYQRFQRVMARFSRPPMSMSVTLLPRHHDIEIGDIMRVTLPIRDLATGLDLDRAFEVLQVSNDLKTGQVKLKLIAQPEKSAFWNSGVGAVATASISPAAVSMPVSTTQQMSLVALDASGNQMLPGTTTWVATGNVSVSASGLVTASATAGSGTVKAVLGAIVSNIATVTVTASANTNIVASVTIAPTSIGLQPAAVQQMAATAFDVAGAQVNVVSFTWASDNVAVATVSANGLVTAVANGTANITATETSSSIMSSPTAVTVANAAPPQVTPPVIADAVYQVGTQLTAADPRITGDAMLGYTIVDGSDFASGDYWFDGNVTLATGTTCTVNGTVRIFAYGNVTINGTVDGVGRGGTGMPGVANTFVWVTSYLNHSIVAPSPNGLGGGFVGKGGDSEGFNTAYTPFAGGASPASVIPTIAVVATAQDASGTWTAVSGLPTALHGAGGAMGESSGYVSGGAVGGAGGSGGAGFLVMARGIFVTTGLIDLRGGDGTSGTVANAASDTALGAGSGAGGSFVALAERDANGLPVLSVSPSRILVTGGLNVGSIVGFVPITLGARVPAQVGGTGAQIAQVIG